MNPADNERVRYKGRSAESKFCIPVRTSCLLPRMSTLTSWLMSTLLMLVGCLCRVCVCVSVYVCVCVCVLVMVLVVSGDALCRLVSYLVLGHQQQQQQSRGGYPPFDGLRTPVRDRRTLIRLTRIRFLNRDASRLPEDDSHSALPKTSTGWRRRRAAYGYPCRR